ncbi:MAG: hypothetical protein ACFE8U_06415, partial [Candidatus Hermodarchaeota archaeon]
MSVYCALPCCWRRMVITRAAKSTPKPTMAKRLRGTSEKGGGVVERVDERLGSILSIVKTASEVAIHHTPSEQR